MLKTIITSSRGAGQGRLDQPPRMAMAKSLAAHQSRNHSLSRERIEVAIQATPGALTSSSIQGPLWPRKRVLAGPWRSPTGTPLSRLQTAKLCLSMCGWMMAGCGLRISEMALLKVEHLDGPGARLLAHREAGKSSPKNISVLSTT